MAERDPKVPREGQDPVNVSGEVDEAEAAMATGGDGSSAGASDAELEQQALTATGRVSPGAPTTGQRGPRFVNFLRACWAELQRVQWPDRRQVGQATAVVIGFVIVAGAYLGLADAVASEFVDLIL